MRSPRVRVIGGVVGVAVWIGVAALAVTLPSPWGQLLGGALIVSAAYGLIWVAESQAVGHTSKLEHLHAQTVDCLREEAAEGRRREAALAYTTDAVLIVRPGGHVEYANPTARMFLADRVLEVTGRLSQPDLERLVERATATQEPVLEDVTLWVPGARPARARAIPLGDGTTILLLSDLSESYRLDRVRRDFVANVSHELKTPAAAIRALAESAGTALTSDDLAHAVRFVERLGTEATRLATLVGDLLDLSRVEAGELHLSPVDLEALMIEAAERGRVIGEAKDIEVLVHKIDIVIESDASQLGMAIKNLVDNAVRYSEGGKVELSAERRGDAVVISVSDQGIGIPSDELGRIFERFYRVDKGRARATGGTGLGLSIVRHVAENHGGHVSAESGLGVGTTFTLTLPAEPRWAGMTGT